MPQEPGIPVFNVMSKVTNWYYEWLTNKENGPLVVEIAECREMYSEKMATYFLAEVENPAGVMDRPDWMGGTMARDSWLLNSTVDDTAPLDVGAGGDRDGGAEGGEVGLRGRPVGRGGLGVRRGRGRRAHDQALQGQAWGGRLAWGENHWIVPEQRSGQRQAGAKSEHHLRAKGRMVGGPSGTAGAFPDDPIPSRRRRKTLHTFFGTEEDSLVTPGPLGTPDGRRHHRLFVRSRPIAFLMSKASSSAP